MKYKVLAINPGSTSTKVALFWGDDAIIMSDITHDASTLAGFQSINAQMPMRMAAIETEIARAGVALEGLHAVVGRGGGLVACEGGTYAINETLLGHATTGANGVSHPAQLGPQLAHKVAQAHACPAFVVNPPDTDELMDKARVTGIRGVYRNVHLHALNLKETAIRHAQARGECYEMCRLIVCHLGGGISISAHKNGRMIDGNDIVGGEGPMAPTRCGAVPVSEVLRLAQREDLGSIQALCNRQGGFVNHLGTADAYAVFQAREAGDWYASLVWDAMVYQITKAIGAMACSLDGQVDGILLGGGMVRNESLVGDIRKACAWIAPVTAYPGEFEMEAMNAGAQRVLSGAEGARQYTGVPVWQAFAGRAEGSVYGRD